MVSVARHPALIALISQVVALVVTGSIAALVISMPEDSPPALLLALCQGTVAAGISFQCRQAVWWQTIHVLFPLAVITALSLPLPNWIFLTGFVAFATIYWTSFRTQVPFYPSGKSVWNALLRNLPSHSKKIIDIGSGIGGLVLHLASARPDASCVGIEAAPLPWLISRMRAACRRVPCQFLWGSYESLDLATYDVVFAYLSPAAMPALWRKASAEMRPGTLLFSYEFPVEGVEASSVVEIAGESAVLYCWRM
jgi:hypothetical protein